MSLNGPDFQESRLLVRFDPSWRVLAYDRSPWFRQLTGQGLKGVDLIGLREDHLWLVEIKNYLPVDGVNTPPLPSAEDLTRTIEEKGADTRRMVRSIYTALSGHFLFRAWRWLSHLLPFLRAMEPEWTFWCEANAALDRGSLTQVLILRNWPADRPFPASAAFLVQSEATPPLPGLHIEPDLNGISGN